MFTLKFNANGWPFVLYDKHGNAVVMDVRRAGIVAFCLKNGIDKILVQSGDHIGYQKITSDE